MAPAPEKADYAQLLRHFQSINASNLSSTINILLTLATGVAAFCVNLIVTSKSPLGHFSACLLASALACLFLSVGAGIWLLFNRIADYRITIEALVLERDNPGPTTDEKLIRTADQIKVKADRINKRTTRLLRGQALLFIVGFTLVGLEVLLAHASAITS